jgi:hypothetical protein
MRFLVTPAHPQPNGMFSRCGSPPVIRGRGCASKTLFKPRLSSENAQKHHGAGVESAYQANACVVEGALRRHDLVVSSDECDLHAIAAAVSRRLEIDHP